MLFLRDEFKAAWPDPFTQVQQQSGEIFRAKEGRRTLRFELAGRAYFLKVHSGVGWGEVAKNLLQLRAPVIGASNEWQAILHLQRVGIPTMTLAAYGSRGSNPARQLSFIVTDELQAMMSLEDYCKPWAQVAPGYREKKQLIEAVAHLARQMHSSGMNHRDFYLCHLLLPLAWLASPAGPVPLYVIDLHRAQLRSRVPRRWLVKDLGALYYSAADIGLTGRDVVRFIRAYWGGVPRGRAGRQLLAAIDRRARKIYQRDFPGRKPGLPDWDVSE